MPVRINKFVAQASGLSRRSADDAISQGRVHLNDRLAVLGDSVNDTDRVKLDGKQLSLTRTITLMLNKPAGYVCSRDGQGSPTIYDLLPSEYHKLKPVGRLDKDSSGLLLMTDDGDLANRLAHPRYAKTKVYQVRIDKPLQPLHHQMINDQGIQLQDGPSRLGLLKLDDKGEEWQVTMSEGRNRQIRRTFEALGYKVTSLNRTQFGNYRLVSLHSGQFIVI